MRLFCLFGNTQLSEAHLNTAITHSIYLICYVLRVQRAMRHLRSLCVLNTASSTAPPTPLMFPYTITHFIFACLSFIVVFIY